MKAMSENEKTTVQAVSASRMDMRREARNQLVFLREHSSCSGWRST